ncbi:MAG: CinA family protein [Acholeplasmataceae bacterium]|nr:CinA family protein [Acholeplasmataceae bacterium]
MISKELFNKLLDKGLTIAFAESMTGGAATYELMKNPGASKVISGSIVAYSVKQKHNLLNITLEDINKYGIVSKEISSIMARKIKDVIGSDIGVGITGNAGPTLQEKTLKQEAWVSILCKQEMKVFYIDLEAYSRVDAIEKTVQFIYEKLNTIL